MARKRERLSRFEKWLFTATVIGGVILFAAPVWWLSLEADPDVTIPAPPPLPRPNAFDHYVSASGAITYPVDLWRAIAEPGTPGYKSAIRVTLPNGQTVTRAVTRAEKSELLQQNVAVLQSVRRGFSYAYREPSARSYFTTFPHYSKYRSMAQVFVLEGQVRAARGDWKGAADSYLDGMRFSTDIARGVGTVGRSVSVSCQSMAQRALWKTVNHLDATQARAVIMRLEQIRARMVPLSQTLQEQKWTGQSSLMEVFRSRNWRSQLLSMYGITNENGQVDSSTRVLSWMISKRIIMHNYAKLMDAQIASAQMPYGRAETASPPTVDLFSQSLVRSFKDVQFSDARAEANTTLLLVALALRAYRLEHGAYPAKLDALQPGLLNKIPVDPFAANTPLRYKRTGKQYSLYSIGPDGRDDGGKVLTDPGRPGGVHSYYSADSKGDIVADGAGIKYE